MKCAVIDLSSTGVSVVIAEGDKTTGLFSAVYKDRANIAVADYFDGRSISARGIEKLIDALITARANCRAMGVEECYCISTAALRNIDNIEEVAERIRMRTGIVINYLDGITEAYCDFVSNRKYAAYDDVILIDIGGGSVELCDLHNTQKADMICLDFGTIKLRNKYVTDVYPTPEQAKAIKKYVRKRSDDSLRGKKKYATAVLVGSINDALYAAYREYCEKEKLSSEFNYDKYKQFVKWMLTSSDRTRLIMKVAPEKIHVLPVAAVVLKEMLRRFKPENVIISDCGVKEGYMSLVATGEEKGVPVDLDITVPAFEPPPPPRKKKSKAAGQKPKAGAKTTKPAGQKTKAGAKTTKPAGQKTKAGAKTTKTAGQKTKAGEKTTKPAGKKPEKANTPNKIAERGDAPDADGGQAAENAAGDKAPPQNN